MFSPVVLLKSAWEPSCHIETSSCVVKERNPTNCGIFGPFGDAEERIVTLCRVGIGIAAVRWWINREPSARARTKWGRSLSKINWIAKASGRSKFLSVELSYFLFSFVVEVGLLTAIQFSAEPGTIPREALWTASSFRLTRGSKWIWWSR